MPPASLAGLHARRLRLWLVLFFLALAVPTTILIYHAYSQLKWEAFHRYRVMAEELSTRIDRRINELVNTEEARAFADYAFLVVAGDPSASFVQRSPLSAYPAASAVPGLIGYFQVDAGGEFSTPLLPEAGVQPSSYGITGRELEQRRSLQQRIHQILAENRLVEIRRSRAPNAGAAASYVQAPATETAEREQLESSLDEDPGARAASLEEAAPEQAAFDRLSEEREKKAAQKSTVARALGRVEDLKLDPRYQRESRDDLSDSASRPGSLPRDKRSLRKERSAMPEQRAEASGTAPSAQAPAEPGYRVSMFESEIDAFSLSLLGSGHLVLFRKVWRDGIRYTQGALIESRAFLQGVIESAFRETALARVSDLVVAFAGDVLSAFGGRESRAYLSSAEELQGALLYQTRLTAPLNDMSLIFSVRHLPAGPGGTVITWTAVILFIVLCGGFYLMYRLGVGQITLARQQQDFVSAVSHELKTPLTSIRMYGEILREGWADEEKKKTYYAYIHDESERLSRLIANVLQLARMSRNDLKVELKSFTADTLMDHLQSKIGAQVERAGFDLRLDCDGDTARSVIQADLDYFTQIFINLVDNAIKFSAKAETKAIDVTCRRQHDGSVLFAVRDYGLGVEKDQMKKIFRLFYRTENELTRETVGTGIGLALVHQLAQAMNGRVDVANREPGAEFRVAFPPAH